MGKSSAGIALRATHDERVQRFGHIGYGVRPSARGRGVATWALGEVLRHAVSLGIDPVVAFCLDDNAGSVATLERHGATLEAVEQHGTARVRRYAIRPESASFTDRLSRWGGLGVTLSPWSTVAVLSFPTSTSDSTFNLDTCSARSGR